MRLYFMSVCGTGMGNAALLMRQLGHEVLGCDRNIYPPMSDALQAAGIEILPDFDVERLQRLQPDLVVVGNVNTRGNPEIEWLLETRAIPYTSLPGLLHSHLLNRRRNIVVTGTHGKTTTTCMTAHLLRQHGQEPGWLLGGVPRDLPGGSELGRADAPFVIEGDEYDSAFFDKRSKFIHYAPNIVVLNHLEFDHADIFRDLADVQRTFSHLLRIVPQNGFILANGDDPNQAALVDAVSWCRVLKVGTEAANDLQIRGFSEDERGSRFQLVWRGTVWGRVQWKQWGLYNARNAAMACLSAGLALKPDDPFCAIEPEKLQGYQGVKRRQEVLFDNGTTTLLSDFGHHPTAIRQTLESLKQRYKGRPVVACFEARSNTACRKVLETDFAGAFVPADRVHFGAVFRAERYRDEDRIDLPAIATQLGPQAVAHGSNEAMGEALQQSLRDEPRQVVVFFSNGSFDGMIEQTVQAVAS